MTGRGIRFTGQEFEILWAAYGRDRLPYPLSYRTGIADFDELKRGREAAVRTLLDKYAEEIEYALSVLVEPEARIESKGFGGQDLSRVYRFHGAVTGQAGVALIQEPGIAPDIGGDITLNYCAATTLAQRAVVALPQTGPGAQPPLALSRNDIATDRKRCIRRTHDLSLTDRLDRIFKRPRRALGEITVFPGPAIDARPTFGRAFWWMDYADGRYYVETGDPIVAEPIDAPGLTTKIHHLTALTQRYYREDRTHDEYLRSRP
ncbi:ESX secretion-associated protein EspG [Nocardia mexicana]|uniref:ESX secretion-associated protein EspG n=1 Tax=Nocardia mexicana TaxID=279262 RepID=UPI000AF1B3A0|nr:ESX secretion-associated protein EspG [Nocardia mexicana]